MSEQICEVCEEVFLEEELEETVLGKICECCKDEQLSKPN